MRRCSWQSLKSDFEKIYPLQLRKLLMVVNCGCGGGLSRVQVTVECLIKGKGRASGIKVER